MGFLPDILTSNNNNCYIKSYLAHNGLSEIPEGIANLSNLKKLDLGHNQLRSLPKEIATLTETLVELNIQGNQLSQEEIQWFVEAMPHTQIRF